MRTQLKSAGAIICGVVRNHKQRVFLGVAATTIGAFFLVYFALFRPTTEELIVQLDSPVSYVRIDALRRLENERSDVIAVALVNQIVTSDDFDWIVRVSASLALYGPDATERLLREDGKDGKDWEGPDTPRWFGLYLGQTGGGMWKGLERALESESAKVRMRALEVLVGMLPPENAVGYLRRLSKDPDPDVREHVELLRRNRAGR